MSTTDKRATLMVDPKIRKLLKEVAASRQTTVQALTETALLQWCRRQRECREAKKGA